MAQAQQDFPVMHFTPQELLVLHDDYMEAPKALIRPAIPFKYIPPEDNPIGEQFDLLKYFPYIPKERLQHCNDCWVWACTGALEIDRAVRKGTMKRLSVQWFNSNYDGCCGGFPSKFAEFYSGPKSFSKKKPIPWSNANAYYHKVQKGESCTDRAVPADEISASPYYSIEHCEAQVIPTTNVDKETAIANIKDILKQKKAVIFLYKNVPNNNFGKFWGTEKEDAIWHFDNWNCGGIECYGEISEGHAVLCVGYDDRDPKNRYWIMVNSWPTNFDDLNEEQKEKYPHINRPNNIFRVSMDMDYDSTYRMPAGCSENSSGCDVEQYFFKWWTLKVSSAGDGVGFVQGDKISSSFKLDKDISGSIDQEISYAGKGDMPIKGDWDNDGIDGIGYFRPDGHTFHLDNNRDSKDDKILSYGESKDLPLAGKWARRPQKNPFSLQWQEGIGYFRPSDHTFHLDGNLDEQDDMPPISYGSSDSVPLSGDWNGDGHDGIGYYSRSDFTFHLDDNLDGKDDRTLNYLVMFDKLPNSPIPGELNYVNGKFVSGISKHGPFLPTKGETKSEFDPKIIGPMQKPLVGDWNEDGKDEVGVVIQESRWKKTTSMFHERVNYLCFYLEGGRFAYYKITPNVSVYPISGNWN